MSILRPTMPESGPLYDEFGFEVEPTLPAVDDVASGPHVPLRFSFPPAGSHYMGGSSDGWEYRTAFNGARLEVTYQMVRQFLQEEGYGDVPLPADVQELRQFRKSRTAQLSMFAERGYIHNPLKILFSSAPGMRNVLVLCLYNEQAPQHLLRFHGLVSTV